MCRSSRRSRSRPAQSPRPMTARRRSSTRSPPRSTPHRGPVFVDFPMDVIFGSASALETNGTVPRGVDPDPADVERAAALIAGAARPAIIVGSDVYWEGAWTASTRFVETMRVPCWFNGLGRGCLPADHELAFTRTRGLLKTDADLVVVIGTALDFRLGFGRFGTAEVVHICDSPESRAADVATRGVAGGRPHRDPLRDDRVGAPIASTTSPGSPVSATPRRSPRRPSETCSRRGRPHQADPRLRRARQALGAGRGR